MVELGGGSIVNMSSITWQVGVPELMGYASAKAAVVGFTHSLARQVGKHSHPRQCHRAWAGA